MIAIIIKAILKYFRKFQRELVLPFLWAQDGFDTPSPEMADAIRLGLDVPAKGKRLVG